MPQKTPEETPGTQEPPQDPAAPAPRTPVLSLTGASKSFGHVQALHSADVSVRAGQVLGIVGDNGAGKSTVLKVLSGLYPPDAGRLEIDGEQVALAGPADARSRGIATVHQDLALVECLDVATNLHLGDVPRGRFLVDRRRMERDAEQVLADLNVRVGSVRTPVGMLSGGQRQIIAISRAVRLEHSKVVLLDEPTAALGIQERGRVGEIVERLKDLGKAVVVICHDLDFVFTYCDDVTVMRLGRTVADLRVAATTRDEVVGYITGAHVGSAA